MISTRAAAQQRLAHGKKSVTLATIINQGIWPAYLWESFFTSFCLQKHLEDC